jgi:hypothetical protein
MTNTFAPSEQAFDKVDQKAPAHGDSGAATIAKAAYEIGTKVEGIQKSPTDKDATAVDMPPLWNGPQSNSNAMNDSAAAGSKAPQTGWEPYEALDLQVKRPPSDTPQSNSNFLGDKSGWTPYEALDLQVKPLSAVEKK